MPRKIERLSYSWSIILLAVIMLATATQIYAQETEEPPPTPRQGRIVITQISAASLPAIELRAYGVAADGQALNLASQELLVTHNGLAAATVDVVGAEPVGTLTVFVLDLPQGVAGRFETIQNLILSYASAPTMQEQVDQVAIYRIGDAGMEALLAPTSFHNGVRNFFANPLAATAGLTALYDSTVNLLGQIDSLKTRPDMLANIVLVTDGTDAISTQFDANALPLQAAARGVTVHTVWLDNANLSPAGQQIGQEYLARVAAATGGLYAEVGADDQLAAIGDRIAAFRNQIIVRYTVSDLAAGTFPVNFGLANDPSILASTNVEIPIAAPLIEIVLPLESRTLTLPDLLEPVRLKFATTLRWLGEVENSATRAQIVINGVAQEVAVADLAAFDVAVDNLQFGVNTVQVAIVDDAGGQATSLPVELIVEEGDRSIPSELAAGGVLGGGGGLMWLWCLIGLALFGLALLAVAFWFRLRIPGLDKLRERLPERFGGNPEPGNVRFGPPANQVQPAQANGAAQWHNPAAPAGQQANLVEGHPWSAPFIEIMASQTRLPKHMNLESVEVRLGRSPQSADIIFEQDPTVSRLHASIVRDGYEYRLYDEQSTSGTLVNGVAVPGHGVALIDGDEIHMGAVQMRFRQPGAV